MRLAPLPHDSPGKHFERSEAAKMFYQHILQSTLHQPFTHTLPPSPSSTTLREIFSEIRSSSIDICQGPWMRLARKLTMGRFLLVSSIWWSDGDVLRDLFLLYSLIILEEWFAVSLEDDAFFYATIVWLYAHSPVNHHSFKSRGLF